jgi:hypothetical protein
MTQANQDLAQVSFHEATIVNISRLGDVVDLALDGVLIADTRRPANVTVEGVRGVLRDGSPANELHMEEEDGEILTLREEGEDVILVVQWNDFATKRQDIVVYKLLGGKIVLHK